METLLRAFEIMHCLIAATGMWGAWILQGPFCDLFARVMEEHFSHLSAAIGNVEIFPKLVESLQPIWVCQILFSIVSSRNIREDL